jgi:two-component system, NtrC family, response regulator AtoC
VFALKDSSKSVSGKLAQPARMLLVSREPSALSSLWAIGERNAWEMETTGSGLEALERVQSEGSPALVLLDLAREDADGFYTLRWLRRVRPDLPIVVLSQTDNTQHRLEAIRLGAQDYLVQPFEPQQLEGTIRQHLDLVPNELAAENGERPGALDEDLLFVATSPVMRKLRAQVELLAQVDVPVLIVGEAGSGKEATARLIHKLSVRSGFRFRTVNCAALPGDMLERELFGYEPGAFPGALGRKTGKFELSENGTILLDEIAQIPLALQARLLEVVQERRFARVGGQSPIAADVRIIAASNGNLEQALAERRLREDLYYRLSAFTVHVPPLRQRQDEIPLLLGRFMSRLAKHYGLPPRTFSSPMLDACREHTWPGNLRELENFVKRYLVMGDENLALSELGRDLDLAAEPGGAAESGDTGLSGLRSLVQTVKGETERNAIAVALEQTGWNRKAAARLLKVSYRTLLYKIQQYHLSPPPAYLSSPFTGPGVKGSNHGQ